MVGSLNTGTLDLVWQCSKIVAVPEIFRIFSILLNIYSLHYEVAIRCESDIVKGNKCFLKALNSQKRLNLASRELQT